jgi:hypothetical protein
MNIQFRDWKLATNEREKYQLYLASREWAEKKERVKSRSLGTCERCHYAAGEQVHHLTYAHKYQEPLEDLMHLCEPCHEFLSAKRNRDPKLAAPPFLEDKYGFCVPVKSAYLAGKITNDYWRDELVDGYSGENDGIIHGAWGAVNDWQTVPRALPIPDGRRLNLTGPFWRPVDDSGGHGSIEDNPGSHRCGFPDYHPGLAQSLVLDLIKAAIRRSDFVFAWIDSPDCYGTLIEIGYAHAWGERGGKEKKFIVVARPELKGRDELWMADHLADRCIKAPSPKEAWEKLWKDA